MVSKQIKSKLSLSSNISYGGFTRFQWGARLLYIIRTTALELTA